MSEPQKARQIAMRSTFLIGVCSAAFLSGCVPVPADSRYMQNGERKPMELIGTDEKAAVRIGQTTTQDAVELISERISGPTKFRPLAGPPFVNSVADVKDQIMQLVDLPQGGHRYAFEYAYRTWYVYYLFLGGARETETQTEFLVLETNRDGIVTGAKIMRDVQSLFPPGGAGSPFAMTRPQRQF